MLEDLQQAFRTVVRRRGLYLLVAVILALGIGATVATLTLAEAVLLRPIPYPDGHRLVTVYEQNLEANVNQMLLSHPSFRLLEETRSLDRVAAYQNFNSLTLSGEGAAIRVQSNFVSENYFSLVGARAEAGALFGPEAHSGPMAQRVVVLSWGLWQDRFGGDPGIVGQAVQINGEPFEVAGILQRGFVDLPAAGNPTQVWLPLETYPMLGFDWPLIERRTTRFLAIVARIADGYELEQARAEMQALAQTLEDEFPAAHDGYTMITRYVGDFQAEPFRPAILALLGGAFFVLLIGCANAANLLLVRATARRSEIAVHMALGAGGSRMARRLTLEGLLTSLLAGALGLALGVTVLETLLRISPVSLPDHIVLEPSPAVLAATLTIAVGTGLLFGLVPGLAVCFQNVSGVLRAEGRGSSRSGERWRRGLIVVEVSSAVTLLLGGLLMAQSFRNLSQSPIGFETENLLTLRTSAPTARYDTPERMRTFARQLREEIESTPGVETAIVWSRSMPSQATWYRSFNRSGRTLSSLSDTVAGRWHTVSPGAIEALGLPLLRGRGIGPEDHAESRPVVVISESTAAALFADEDPLGRSIYRWNSPESDTTETHYTVVGIVADARLAGRSLPLRPPFDVYYSYDQVPLPELNLLVRTRLQPAALTPTLRSAVASIDPELPLYDILTMEERIGIETEQSRFAAFLSAAFAAISALLAGLGLYSVLAYFAQTRTREIGLRMALGSRRWGIVAWMSRQTVRILALGLFFGLAASVAVGRLIEGSLFGVNALDPRAFVAVALAISLVAGLASLLPALRASRIDPSIALRSD